MLSWLPAQLIVRAFDAGVAGAVGAAEELVVGFDAVADDPAAAVVADRGELMNRALEAVKGVAGTRRHDLERQVVIVAAYFALSHVLVPSLMKRASGRAKLPL